MSDEIAIVGVAGRFPGAPDPGTLWRRLCDGVDLMHDHTEAELRAEGIGPALVADPAHVRGHGRLAGVEDFDAALFGIGADDAARLDPQHRLFLEQAWVALEDAGCDPRRYPGTVGVFAGCSANRYFLFHLFGNRAVADPDPDDWEARVLSGMTADHLPTQVAYRLGLTGPAIATQAACASSLVAVCQAAQSLADVRCDLALAGGVAVIGPRYRYTPGGLYSPDGRCRAFDARAQGSGHGSGVAVLALKRLDDALADQDRIHAILRGWAVSNDGAVRAGYTAPGVAGQTGVVVEALASADVAAESIGMVEAHASGTLVGDAIEVAALTAAFDGAPAGGCALGSVKTNVGNLDAATGATGLIKAVFAVRDGIIPASLHFDQPSPEIDFPNTPFVVPTKTVPWPAGATPRRAGVSSFGQGGTNAHVIVEEPPADLRAPENARWHVLPLSAARSEDLAVLARNLRAHLVAASPAPRLDDLAHTLGQGRRQLGQRAAVVCRDVAGAIAALGTAPEGGLYLAGKAEADAATARALAEAWCRGDDVAWPIGPDARVVSLPHYPFRRTRHWIDPPTGGA